MKNWDVFISHASENKAEIARPLASKLKRLGLRVWLDEAELKLGDSLSRKIDDGLSRSNAGVVVLSREFFEKKWPEYELRGLAALTMSGESRILPVWHKVSQQDVVRFSPTLADSVAADTSESLDKIALRIASAVRPDLGRAINRKIARAKALRNAAIELRPASEIEKGPIRHRSFPSKLVDRIDLVRAALLEVHPLSRTEWMEGFQRDSHPSSEVEIWETIAARYSRSIQARNLQTEGKLAVFQMLLAASLGDNETAAIQLRKAFGEGADEVLASMRYDIDVFAPVSDEDEKLQRELDVELEHLTGPEAAIDLTYVEELVAAEAEIS